jgi:hypothetical protein
MGRMGKASSGKKVARAARAGGGLTRRRNTSYGYPTFIAVVVIIGIALIAFSRHEVRASAAPVSAPTKDNSAPRLGDHWHAAYGFYICGKWQANTPQFENTQGIHTHGDGIIHIHPFSLGKRNPFTGKNANLGAYMELAKGRVTSQQIKVPAGTKKVNGDKCSGKTGEVIVKTWKKGEPVDAGQIYTGNPEKLKLEDQMLITIAFMPKGSKIPQPPSASTLDNLSDVTAPTTTVPAGTTPTAPPTTATPATTAAPATTKP